MNGYNDFAAVAAVLMRAIAWDVTIEYPGFILLTGGPGGGAWTFGTANQDWGGDFCPEEDAEVARSFVVEGSAGYTDPEQIAAALIAGMERAS